MLKECDKYLKGIVKYCCFKDLLHYHMLRVLINLMVK